MTTIIGIYLVVDIIDEIGELMESGLPFLKAAFVFLAQVPLTEFIPLCVLLSVTSVFGLMNKNNEIVAYKSGGVSVYALLRPVLRIGLFFTLVFFFLAEVVIPITKSEADRIWRVEVEKQSVVTSRGKNIWIRGDRSILHIAYFNPAELTIHGISLNYFNDEFQLVRRLDADRGTFENGQWVFERVMEQILQPDTDRYRVSFVDRHVENIPFVPEDFNRVTKKSTEMNVKELYDYIAKVESEGYNATSYRVDFQTKTAFPFLCLIMCLLGTGIAVHRSRKDRLAFSIGLGVITAFLYWVLYSFCVSLGYGGGLPPFLAAWTANLIFSAVGIVALISAEH